MAKEAKHRNEVGIALLQAKQDRAALYGASDDEQDAAERRITLADRRAEDCEAKRTLLSEAHKAATLALRRHKEKTARAAAIEAGLAHAEAARKASATGAEYIRLKFDANNARYEETIGDLPDFPIHVIDLQNSGGANARVDPVHASLERFAFMVTNLARKELP